jgi:hypothetical protein
MSATMARQGGCVQLQQFEMRLALNMPTMAKQGFSRTTIDESTYLIKKPCAKVQEEKKRGVKFPRHKKVKAAIQRHPAMLRQNHTSGCLSCHMAPQRMRSHAGDAVEQVHFHPTDAERRLQCRLHFCPAPDPPQPITLPECKVLNSSICRLDIHISIQHFPVWNLSMMMRIPSTIPILI